MKLAIHLGRDQRHNRLTEFLLAKSAFRCNQRIFFSQKLPRPFYRTPSGCVDDRNWHLLPIFEALGIDPDFTQGPEPDVRQRSRHCKSQSPTILRGTDPDRIQCRRRKRWLSLPMAAGVLHFDLMPSHKSAPFDVDPDATRSVAIAVETFDSDYRRPGGKEPSGHFDGPLKRILPRKSRLLHHGQKRWP